MRFELKVLDKKKKALFKGTFFSLIKPQTFLSCNILCTSDVNYPQM